MSTTVASPTPITDILREKWPARKWAPDGPISISPGLVDGRRRFCIARAAWRFVPFALFTETFAAQTFEAQQAIARSSWHWNNRHGHLQALEHLEVWERTRENRVCPGQTTRDHEYLADMGPCPLAAPDADARQWWKQHGSKPTGGATD